MPLGEIIALVDELEGDIPKRRARALVDELELRLEATAFVDRTTRDRLEAALARHGVVLREPPGPWSPPAGETYLPLYSEAAATVGRLAIRRVDRPGVAGASLSAPTLSHARAAFEGLSKVLSARGSGIPDVFERGHRVDVEHGGGERQPVDGPSLGLPLCVAMLSSYLGRAPRADVAGSAEVTIEGGLRAVGGMGAKIAAIERELPHVRTVVVAKGQEDATSDGDLTIVACADLAAAWSIFGLDFTADALPSMGLAALRRRLAAFAEEAVHDNATDDWRRLSTQAAYVAKALASVDATEAAQAHAWAALFALHAGEEPAAARYIRSVSAEAARDLAPAGRVWFEIIQASTRIDAGGNLDEAIDFATQACAIGETELRGADRRALLGRCYGTLGRAYMHRGRHEDALVWLRRGADLHRAERPDEAARSMNYLATCLRLSGRADEALSIVDEALALARSQRHAESSKTTEIFLSLERGRSLLRLERLDEARDELTSVVARQTADHDYPRIAALRALSTALARAGRAEEAGQFLARCVAVAENDRVGPVLRGVAAYAAGDALLDPGRVTQDLRPRLESAWRVHGPADAEHVAAVLAAAVY
jgi:tetratricopeptide (TPR) repeat protein